MESPGDTTTWMCGSLWGKLHFDSHSMHKAPKKEMLYVPLVNIQSVLHGHENCKHFWPSPPTGDSACLVSAPSVQSRRKGSQSKIQSNIQLGQHAYNASSTLHFNIWFSALLGSRWHVAHSPDRFHCSSPSIFHSNMASFLQFAHLLSGVHKQCSMEQTNNLFTGKQPITNDWIEKSRDPLRHQAAAHYVTTVCWPSF